MHPQRLSVRIRPSVLLSAALALVHGAAAVCVLGFVPRGWLAATITVAITASLVFHLRRDALLAGAESIVEITVGEDGYCHLILRNGMRLAGTIEGSTFVTPWLTVINIRTDARRRACVLLPDSAPAQDLRRLRIWLRHRALPADAASRPF